MDQQNLLSPYETRRRMARIAKLFPLIDQKQEIMSFENVLDEVLVLISFHHFR